MVPCLEMYKLFFRRVFGRHDGHVTAGMQPLSGLNFTGLGGTEEAVLVRDLLHISPLCITPTA